MVIFIPGKVDFKTKTLMRDKEGNYIVIKGSIQQKICKYLCTQHRSTKMYEANINRPKGEIDSNVMLLG